MHALYLSFGAGLLINSRAIKSGNRSQQRKDSKSSCQAKSAEKRKSQTGEKQK